MNKPKMPGWWEDHPHAGRLIELTADLIYEDMTLPKGIRLRVTKVSPGLDSGNGYWFQDPQDPSFERCVSARQKNGSGKNVPWLPNFKLIHPLEDLALSLEAE